MEWLKTAFLTLVVLFSFQISGSECLADTPQTTPVTTTTSDKMPVATSPTANQTAQGVVDNKNAAAVVAVQAAPAAPAPVAAPIAPAAQQAVAPAPVPVPAPSPLAAAVKPKEPGVEDKYKDQPVREGLKLGDIPLNEHEAIELAKMALAVYNFVPPGYTLTSVDFGSHVVYTGPNGAVITFVFLNKEFKVFDDSQHREYMYDTVLHGFSITDKPIDGLVEQIYSVYSLDGTQTGMFPGDGGVIGLIYQTTLYTDGRYEEERHFKDKDVIMRGTKEAGNSPVITEKTIYYHDGRIGRVNMETGNETVTYPDGRVKVFDRFGVEIPQA